MATTGEANTQPITKGITTTQKHLQPKGMAKQVSAADSEEQKTPNVIPIFSNQKDVSNQDRKLSAFRIPNPKQSN